MADTYTIIGTDGTKLFCKMWIPSGKPRAIVYIAPGTFEHMGLYENFGQMLAQDSFLVFGHDLSGFGKSNGPFSNADVKDLVEDCVLHIVKWKQQYPQLPVFATGFSLGGAILLKCVLKYPGIIKGIILIAPGMRNIPFMNNTLAGYLTNFFVWIRPQLPAFSFKSFKILAEFLGSITPIKTETYLYYCIFRYTCSRCQNGCRELMNDDLFMSAGFSFKALSAANNLYKEIESKIHLLDCPFLLFHGTGDSLVPISGSEYLYENSKTQDKTFKIFEGAKHGLLFELPEVKKEIMDNIIAWIKYRS